jgi:hypothetical protein
MAMINWNISKKDVALINKILDRLEVKGENNRKNARMDFVATHLNGCPLNFEGMLKADDFNLWHDASGIARHLCRETGRLLNHFRPRFALKHNHEGTEYGE